MDGNSATIQVIDYELQIRKFLPVSDANALRIVPGDPEAAGGLSIGPIGVSGEIRPLQLPRTGSI